MTINDEAKTHRSANFERAGLIALSFVAGIIVTMTYLMSVVRPGH